MSTPSPHASGLRCGLDFSLLVRRMLLVTCCAGGALLLGACGSTEALRSAEDPATILPYDTLAVEDAEQLPKPTAIPAPRTPAVSQLIRDALRTDGSISRPALIRRLGPPERILIEPIQNQYGAGTTDTIRTLTYPGLRAMLYEATQSTRNFLIRLVLTSGRYTSPEGLRVGMRSAQVVATIGPPTERDQQTGELVYAEHNSMPTALILTMRHGRVTEIAWEFYFS